MAFRVLRLCLALPILLMAARGVPAAETTSLPLPRFVSLHSDEVNLRAGPGTRYPIDWVYTRRDLPVEVIAEFEEWRKIRDWQGTEGWVHKSMLSPQRMIVVTGHTRNLRDRPDDNAAVLARIQPNVVGRLLGCPHDKRFCRVEVRNIQGWLMRDEFWGIYQAEYFD